MNLEFFHCPVCKQSFHIRTTERLEAPPRIVFDFIVTCPCGKSQFSIPRFWRNPDPEFELYATEVIYDKPKGVAS